MCGGGFLADIVDTVPEASLTTLRSWRKVMKNNNINDINKNN